MSTITPAALFPVSAPFNTNPAYSGTFIPAVWSAKMNAKFYATSTFASVCNTNWEGDAKQGDKVIIRTAPTITTQPYVVGAGLSYAVPTPSTQELNIDKGRSFTFQINDVLEYQAKPDLLDTFSSDAMEQMRVGIDSECWYGTFTGAAAANKGATAGANSAGYNLGTDAAPVTLTAANVLQKILELASVLDEQNVPSEDRWLVMDPKTRTLLMQSNLAQAYYTGDSTSVVRNGLIGQIDRFKTYVTNLLPRATAASNAPWVSGDGSENTITSAGGVPRRLIVAGHKSALTYAGQIQKTETLRNPNDFGDFVRSLNVYGRKCVKPEALALLIAN